MAQIIIEFSDKEIEIINLMAPPMEATEICNRVMKDWLASNIQRLHESTKTLSEKIDEVIADNAAKVAQPVQVDTPVVVQ